MKQNPSIFLKTILTTIVQMLAFYSVIYFVCLALGLNNVSWIGLLSLQAVFSVGLSFLPVPGVVGLTEYGFLTVFSSLFTGDILTTVLVISRTLSFYFLLIVSGLYVGLTFLINKRSL
jgi:uncharacterized membrane protein YbhN (UPF0104 family)